MDWGNVQVNEILNSLREVSCSKDMSLSMHHRIKLQVPSVQLQPGCS